MSNIISYLQKLFSNMGRQISLMTWKDILDILLLTLLFYFVYRFMRDRRAGKLASGVLVVLVLLLLCESL